MDKKKFAIAALLLLVAPLLLYNLVDFVQGYIPPTEPYKKTPYQFEEAFNEQMSAYGMSLDIKSAQFTYVGDDAYKTIAVQCEDGSVVSCTYYPTSDRWKSLIMAIEFEQPLTGAADETIYITPLLEFIMQEFETPMLEDKDSSRGFEELSYNQAVQTCEEFLAGNTRTKEFCISSKDEEAGAYVRLHRAKEGQPSVSVFVNVWRG